MKRADQLADHRSIWERKPVLRLVYDDFYDRIAAACRPGLTIEIGGGIGNLKRRLTDVIATDIQNAPWLDCVADAQRLPFADGCTANIVMVDVLHHLEFPVVFFREAARVLRPGGRVLMVEPAITWGSSLFYRLFHHEPVRTSADALANGSPDPRRDPYASNQAIPTLLATRDRARFHRLFPRCASRPCNGSHLRPTRSAAALSLGAWSATASPVACCASSARLSRRSVATQRFECC